MYPRNAASPEPIAIGAVIQITDGAVQTAGVTVRVKPIGVAEADGGGTVAYSTDGVVIYTPTQAETNHTSFVLIAKKTGCIPVSATVVTSESTVSGRVYAGTVGDKTGYSLTQTFPTNFASLGINSSGHISRVVLVDTTSVNTDMRGTDGAALASNWTATRAGYLDGVLLAQGVHRTVSVTNNHQVHADVHVVQTDAINAAAIAADAVAEIQSGLSTLTAAQVNAEVLDVLATDLFAELAAVPAASSSLKDKIAFLFMLARNRVTQSANTQTLFADNTTTPVAAAATSDVAGTFTRGEFA